MLFFARALWRNNYSSPLNVRRELVVIGVSGGIKEESHEERERERETRAKSVLCEPSARKTSPAARNSRARFKTKLPLSNPTTLGGKRVCKNCSETRTNKTKNAHCPDARCIYAADIRREIYGNAQLGRSRARSRSRSQSQWTRGARFIFH